MNFHEICEEYEPGDTFRRPELDSDEPAMFNAAGDLLCANRRIFMRLTLADYRATDWQWVKRAPRCPKCNQRLPEGWAAPKKGMSLMEIAEQWQEGDVFTNPERASEDHDPIIFTRITHGPVASIYPHFNVYFSRQDLLRTDWFFVNVCPECGQRIEVEK